MQDIVRSFFAAGIVMKPGGLVAAGSDEFGDRAGRFLTTVEKWGPPHVRGRPLRFSARAGAVPQIRVRRRFQLPCDEPNP